MITLQQVESSISLNEFEELFRSQYQDLCSFANRYMSDLDSSEEIVQNVFVKLWENRKGITINHSLRSYLITSVKNACLNKLKHIKIREEYKIYNESVIESGSTDVHEEYEAEELAIKIKSTINSMPPARREIFTLSRNEGLKYKEIAEKLKISVKTVENQMGNAIKYLKTELSEYVIYLIIFLVHQ